MKNLIRISDRKMVIGSLLLLAAKDSTPMAENVAIMSFTVLMNCFNILPARLQDTSNINHF